MSGKAKYKKEAATLPSIDDDKAKFYTVTIRFKISSFVAFIYNLI